MHVEQEVADEPFAKVPVAQGVHRELATLSLMYPGEQEVHMAPTGSIEYVPAAHCEHVAEPIVA